MELETVIYDIADGVATITLNRPEAMNSYTDTLGDDLALAMGAADADDAVRAVVLTGDVIAEAGRVTALVHSARS